VRAIAMLVAGAGALVTASSVIPWATKTDVAELQAAHAAHEKHLREHLDNVGPAMRQARADLMTDLRHLIDPVHEEVAQARADVRELRQVLLRAPVRDATERRVRILPPPCTAEWGDLAMLRLPSTGFPPLSIHVERVARVPAEAP
jgi:hypothetical protein